MCMNNILATFVNMAPYDIDRAKTCGDVQISRIEEISRVKAVLIQVQLFSTFKSKSTSNRKKYPQVEVNVLHKNVPEVQVSTK